MDKQVEALVQISQIVLRYKRQNSVLDIDATVEKCSEVLGYVTFYDALHAS